MGTPFRIAAAALLFAALCSAQSVVRITKPMPPPKWALAERALFKAYGDAAQVFAAKYLDARGYLRCVEHWGGNDGPDDAMENFHNWTLAYALGAPDVLLELYRKAWEGHLQQYTKARIASIPAARDGMYYKEFITSFDWEHTGEELSAFNLYALAASAATDKSFAQRARRFAGLYMNEDPEAPNYDPKLKIIRSLHNGSRGPKLTHATEQDWGGEPIPGKPELLTRYATAGNIRGDHPLNLASATLAMNAYALTGEAKYRNWLLEYTGAWRDRVLANDGNIPTNIGLDGRIGGEWDGKWYGGTFGWNFFPQSNTRNYYMRGARIGFGEAFLLTGDQSFIAPLRNQIANLYAAKKIADGKILLPNKYGEDGWYGYRADQHFDVQRDIYLWTMKPSDLEHISADPWISYLLGKNPGYPESALNAEMERVKKQVKAIHADTSTAERLADDPQKANPFATAALVNLTLGGNDPGSSGNILHARVRYFDPANRRAGLPDDVGALVEKLGSEDVKLTLVNTNPKEARKLIVRMGAYGEHQCTSVTAGGKTVNVNDRQFTVELAPGAGDSLSITMRRYVNQPILSPPW